MARYDRIARISPPARGDAYVGWLALRDLEGQERDGELGRRARLRFLAVRLVHRLSRADGEIDVNSLRLQGDAVREELGQLPGRDPERQRLAAFLRDVPTLDFSKVVAAALDLGDGARTDGHPYAAEEFYRAAQELAARHGLDGPAARAEEGLAGLRPAKG